MRIILGLLVVCLILLLFLDAPLTRGLTDWIKEQALAWFAAPASDGGSEHVAPAPAAQVAPPSGAGCHRTEEKTCNIRKRRGCGPLTLEFSVSDGASHCERASLLLPPARVIPLLRQVRCLLVGTDTRVRFKARNYLPQQGPHDGDTIEVRGGSSDLIVYGHYERADEPAQVSFQNIGPGRSVVLKCEAFGPA